MNSTTVKWDRYQDEIYTTFGKCRNCGWDSVQKGSAHCPGCGKKIIQRKPAPSREKGARG